MIFLALACVLDRTGQSATSAYEREMALQTTYSQALEQEADTVRLRVDQLEEINRYRGKQEAEKLENLDQVQEELQRLRGALEDERFKAERAADDRVALDEDTAFRLEYLELRITALEGALGLEPPQPPDQGPGITVDSSGEVQLVPDGPVEVELGAPPAELIKRAEEALAKDQPALARALTRGLTYGLTWGLTRGLTWNLTRGADREA